MSQVRILPRGAHYHGLGITACTHVGRRRASTSFNAVDFVSDILRARDSLLTPLVVVRVRPLATTPSPDAECLPTRGYRDASHWWQRIEMEDGVA